ncbi:MAG: hypothetical protein ACTHW7_15185, partial [Actinomycetaceae bacterium]
AATRKAAAAGSAFAASALGSAATAGPTTPTATRAAADGPAQADGTAAEEAKAPVDAPSAVGTAFQGDEDGPTDDEDGPTDDELLGLDAPKRPAHLTYSGTSAPTSGADDDADDRGTRRVAKKPAGEDEDGASGLNRAQRRAQAKKAKKRG